MVHRHQLKVGIWRRGLHWNVNQNTSLTHSQLNSACFSQFMSHALTRSLSSTLQFSAVYKLIQPKYSRWQTRLSISQNSSTYKTKVLYFADSGTWTPWCAWRRVATLYSHHRCHQTARQSHPRDLPSCPGRHPRQRSTRTLIIPEITYFAATVGNGKLVQGSSVSKPCFSGTANHSTVNPGDKGSSGASYKDMSLPKSVIAQVDLIL